AGSKRLSIRASRCFTPTSATSRCWSCPTISPPTASTPSFSASGAWGYIGDGAGVESRRGFADKTYGIPSEQVIGSSGVTQYAMWDASPVLIKMPKVLCGDNGLGNPEGINHFIGRQPIFAFGNSDGDKEMLEW